MSEKICLNVREACAALSIGRSTFYQLAGSGRLSLIKLGKKTLVARTELDRFVAACAQEGRAQ
ncbi:excisionase family DNA-binding protein [Xanthomonas campestris pv. campestris]|uniref:excisionase family DNA-binding protein n=1 Tax=Xanthomonas campestris TaxID=339 RepID=UPI0009C04659|nr:excisionase family DNA-binding protein [Xanthomonas campestris]MDM7703404.1 excisionase family DNA-binding protein [Xanthomonas campestris pv. campestris]MEA0858482.1 excisionase family DNA-binding protein [Xanthomonas campestris pv. campestris]MEA0924478.1 excisionase family DNA-binding protein [Xanthomonas campestris pv. campestris]MEB1195367.1 excisionase family DNA-binding protein [Xanthomonas campestris pv. campestris]MEB1215914.1 excisionase family DNA-binding protein [Xanthomonas cam